MGCVWDWFGNIFGWVWGGFPNTNSDEAELSKTYEAVLHEFRSIWDPELRCWGTNALISMKNGVRIHLGPGTNPSRPLPGPKTPVKNLEVSILGFRVSDLGCGVALKGPYSCQQIVGSSAGHTKNKDS